MALLLLVAAARSAAAPWLTAMILERVAQFFVPIAIDEKAKLCLIAWYLLVCTVPLQR